MSNQTVTPGQGFDIPGVPGQTTWFDQTEDTNLLSFTPSASGQQPILGIADFRRTDVVFNWLHHFSFSAVSWTAGTGQTLTNSAYAPYNIIGPTKLQIQNQYNSVDVESGIDLFIFDLVRPYNHRNGNYSINGANPAGSPIGGAGQGYLNSATPQTNLVPNLSTGTSWGRTSTTFDLYFDIPGGIWFDEYYSLDVSGNYLGAIPDIFVSPQFMAGTQRLIKTAISTNPLVGTTTDIAPVQTTTLTPTTDTASTGAAAGVLTIRRQGVYGSQNTTTLPTPQPWQYRRKTDRFSLSGVSTKTIQVPDDAGQVLLSYVRMFDPAASSGVGAPILPTALTQVQFQFGSGQTWWIGTPAELQYLWVQQHGFLMPQGVLAIDFSTDELGTFSNKRAMNTLNTAGIQWVLTFSAPTSSTAYAVLGTESLVYVV